MVTHVHTLQGHSSFPSASAREVLRKGKERGCVRALRGKESRKTKLKHNRFCYSFRAFELSMRDFMIRDINIYFVKNIKMSHGSAIIPLIMLHSYMFNNCFLKRLEKEGFQVVGRVTRGGEGGKGRDIGKEVTHLHTLQAPYVSCLPSHTSDFALHTLCLLTDRHHYSSSLRHNE